MGLAEFTKRVQVLESHRKQLTKEHPNKWVALHDGELEVSDTLEGVLKRLDAKGVAKEETVVEFLSTKRRHLVLDGTAALRGLTPP